MNLGADQEWTSSEVEEARSIIAGGYIDQNKKLNIIGELQAKFPWKPMHQVRDLYVDLVVEMSMTQCQEKEYGGADRMHGVICTIDGHVNKNCEVPEEQKVSMDDKEFSHGFPLKHVGVVEAMKEVPVPKENRVEVLENKMSIHQPIAHCTRRFWTTEEHRLFLRGLRVYGRGKWKDISKYFVTSRTPIQISSHAQKYFKRLESKGSGMQRYSIHDVELNDNDPLKMENSSRPSKRAATIPTSSFLPVPSNPSVTMDNIAQFKFPF